MIFEYLYIQTDFPKVLTTEVCFSVCKKNLNNPNYSIVQNMVLTSVMITHFGIAVTVTMGLMSTNIHMLHYAPVTTTPKVLKSLEEIA